MPSIYLDEIDLRILRQLQQDGRITNHDLSDRIGLSPSPCLRRLEEQNVISRYVALVDPESVGLAVTAFVRVRLHQQDEPNLAAFERAVVDLPQVMECYLMTRDCDYQLRVVVTSLDAFENFLRSDLTRIEGIAQVTTSFALRPTAYRTTLPI